MADAVQARVPLDQFQQAFCSSEAANIRLLAPAGSGKTHSLLYRCIEVARKQEGKRFLVVTFTRAARDELRSRLGSAPFSSFASSIEVTTLNSWGWKRVRDRHHSPKLLNKKDRIFAVQNMLQPVWKKHAKVAAPMQSQPAVTGKALLNLMDQLKNLGFDHTRHKDEDAFNAHVNELKEAGAIRMLDAVARELEDLGIIKKPEVELIYKGFFTFWRQATEAMINQSIGLHVGRPKICRLSRCESTYCRRAPSPRRVEVL